jgi:hypothetical protein
VSLLYAWGYSICQALIPVTEAEKFPLIAASAEQAVAANRRYALRFYYYHEQISQALLDYFPGAVRYRRCHYYLHSKDAHG